MKTETEEQQEENHKDSKANYEIVNNNSNYYQEKFFENIPGTLLCFFGWYLIYFGK